MSGTPVLTPKDPWFTGSLLLTVGVFVVSALAGFVVLPLVQPNFHPQSIWDAICSAAGVARHSSSTAPHTSASPPKACSPAPPTAPASPPHWWHILQWR